ncbi:hypothetical protein [Bacteroides fragilis]|uniref:hypothetical protein n=1 Tax=Bacteroides fragilis TaxID=817 RepID=UPI00202E6FC4|nr:hypothetical protein [Bacteroides fragilis]MCM0315697.1 hypothetical protein [Bacteroides fragilis]
MNKNKTYTVAGHTFSVAMPEGDSLWGSMASAYAPFEDLTHCSSLFQLTINESMLYVEEALVFMDANPREEDAKLDVYRTAYGYLFEMRTPFLGRQNCRLHISDDFHSAQALLSGSDVERLHGLNSALMLCYLLAVAPLDTLLLHASAVLNKGKAYLFLGRSGTGKSTHSRLWIQAIADTRLLNDDHPIVRIDSQGNAIAYGSPWSGKTPCYQNESAPVAGIVRIKQAPLNRIRCLSAVESYASLFTSTAGIPWEKRLADNKDRTLQKIIASVPCFLLECLPDEAAARLCAALLRKEKG